MSGKVLMIWFMINILCNIIQSVSDFPLRNKHFSDAVRFWAVLLHCQLLLAEIPTSLRCAMQWRLTSVDFASLSTTSILHQRPVSIGAHALSLMWPNYDRCLLCWALMFNCVLTKRRRWQYRLSLKVCNTAEKSWNSSVYTTNMHRCCEYTTNMHGCCVTSLWVWLVWLVMHWRLSDVWILLEW